MDSFIDLNSTNLSYYTVPIAFLLAMIPHAYAVKLAGKNYDMANPRRMEENCAKDTSMDKATLRRISRAKAASANGFETLGLYAAGVAAANAAGVATARLNALALGYVASRAAYVYVYVALQDNARMAAARLLAWFAGIAAVVALFVAAGNAAN